MSDTSDARMPRRRRPVMKQQSTQTKRVPDDETPVPRMKKLMEAVAQSEEKARTAGEETARAREQCNAAEARGRSMLAQHNELQAMLKEDAARERGEIKLLRRQLQEVQQREEALVEECRILKVQREDLRSLEEAMASAAKERAAWQGMSDAPSQAELRAALAAEWADERQQLVDAVAQAEQQVAEQQRLRQLTEVRTRNPHTITSQSLTHRHLACAGECRAAERGGRPCFGSGHSGGGRGGGGAGSTEGDCGGCGE